MLNSLRRSVSGVRPISILLRKNFSSDSSEMDKVLSGFTQDVRKTLKDKLNEMERDSYNTAMPSQLNELAANTARMLQESRMKPATPPSRSHLRRDTTKAITALRREVFQRAMTQGMKVANARKMADAVVERAVKVLQQKADSTAAATQKQLDEKAAGKQQMSENEQKLYDFAFQLMDQMYTPIGNFGQLARSASPVEVNEKAEKIFGNAGGALNLFSGKETKTAPLGFWDSMEKRKLELTNKSAGPTNAFEEQIEWTEQGKMWPYPIDNEYLLGEEANISFTEHIFLNKYVDEKFLHLPKDGPIAHFMELVCIGLSKNPYMTVQKKHAHLDAFAEYFNEEHIKKVHRLHEEVERQAALI
ncbi:28S ribosomal protein S31, mitochondrial [Aphelenchoides besseyi]|nr:28S ribosomal protein S31, mitochondrial [Aphelenchoides besseyi]KAI6207431.1 28S ribosomal protein S31, mitochondrial [Aphelenchoides besseyi]